jgi:predicted Fe-Mo cluster-binding NifX family protein
MIVAIPVEPSGQVGHSWGRAPLVAVAEVVDGSITRWDVHEVGWDRSHDEGTHGAHHARVVRFLRENAVDAVLVQHVGEGMHRTLGSMGVKLGEGQHGDARSAVLAAAASATTA